MTYRRDTVFFFAVLFVAVAAAPWAATWVIDASIADDCDRLRSHAAAGYPVTPPDWCSEH